MNPWESGSHETLLIELNGRLCKGDDKTMISGLFEGIPHREPKAAYRSGSCLGEIEGYKNIG